MHDHNALAAANADIWGADPRSVLTALSSAVYQWRLADDHIEWGASAAQALGVADIARLRTGRSWRRLLSSRSPAGRDEAIGMSGQRDDGTGAPFHARYEIVLPRGPVMVEDHGRWFAGVDGRPALVRGVVRLVSRDEAGGWDWRHDVGAAARADLLQRIEMAMTAARRRGKPFALLVGCLSNYRSVDARCGSEGADAMVGLLLRRVQGCIRRTDLLVRYAPNRFGLVLGHCPKDDLANAAQRLSALSCALPIEIDEGRFSPGLSWGGVADLDGAPEARQVLRRAEEAMQEACANDDGFARYAPDRRRDLRRISEQAIADDVVRAVNERRILLARQPIVGATDRKPRFEEALLRMRGDDGRIVSAGAIVPLFEKLGRIELLDHRMLELAIDTLTREPDATLSINVSTTTLLTHSWIETLAGAVVGRADLAARLIVELTESQAIEDVATTTRIFSRLKAMGLRTAIDDFGAGHTSFKHLRRLDVDILKIDGAFVQNISRSADDSFFVRTLIDLAQHLGMETIAEWVRDEESAKKLADWGVTYLQGDMIAAAAIERPRAPPLRSVSAA